MSKRLPDMEALAGIEDAALRLADLALDGDRGDPRHEIVRLQAVESFVRFAADHLQRHAETVEKRGLLIERLATSVEQCNEIISEQASHIETLRAQLEKREPQRLH